jgi:hypothetical protein
MGFDERQGEQLTSV